MGGESQVQASSEYTRELLAAIQRFRQRPRADRPPEVVTAELVQERHAIDLLELDFAETAGCFVQSGDDAMDGSASHIDWIRHACKMSGSTAADRVCVGEHLAALPASAEA